MIHPLFTRLVTQPGLFAEHAGAYAELAAAEAQQLGSRWKRQLLLTVAAGLLAVLGVALAGVSLLLVAAIPVHSMPASWMLWAVPALPWAGAGGCVFLLRRMQSVAAFALLRDQIAADTRLLHEVTA